MLCCSFLLLLSSVCKESRSLLVPPWSGVGSLSCHRGLSNLVVLHRLPSRKAAIKVLTGAGSGKKGFLETLQA